MNVAIPSASLVAVSAQSSSDVWAVGTTNTATGQADLTLHGTAATGRKFPARVPRLTPAAWMPSASSLHPEAWTVGAYGAYDKTLTLRWNGSIWTHVARPTPPQHRDRAAPCSA